MTDCEGDRDRAIELSRAHIEAAYRSERADVIRLVVAMLAVGLAVFAVGTGAIGHVQVWTRNLLYSAGSFWLVVACFIGFQHFKTIRQSVKRRGRAERAIIEARYRECAGITEEE